MTAEGRIAKKVLVVDDEQDIRIYLTKLFEDNGYVVTAAGDGEQAMASVSRERPDLITLDLSMPNKSGVRFYRELKSKPGLSSIPVVFVTGVSGIGEPGDTEHFYTTRKQIPPPDGFISKPIDPDEVLALARKLA